MHPTAVRCIWWAVVLFVVGAIFVVVGPRAFVAAADAIGPGGGAVLDALDVVLTIVRWTTMPLGAALVGSAVVIQTLSAQSAPRPDPTRNPDKHR